MTKRDLDWRPDGAMETYNGFELWEYNVGPHHLNEGEVDGDVTIDEDQVERSADE